jgi:hypothetical protein
MPTLVSNSFWRGQVGTESLAHYQRCGISQYGRLVWFYNEKLIKLHLAACQQYEHNLLWLVSA